MNTIWLATDLSKTAELPWAHALKICATSSRELQVMYVSNGETPAWSELPTVRTLLCKWGYLAADATAEDFQQLGFRVRLKAVEASNPIGLLGAMAEVHAPALLVLGSHRPTGRKRMVDGSVAEALARHAPRASLVVPDGCKPFVDLEDGVCTLRRVLIPVGERAVQQTVEAVASLARSLDVTELEFVYLHIGQVADIPQLAVPERLGWTHRTINLRGGPIVGRVIECAVAEQVDLIAMGTHGHDSWQDALFGSRTERVLRDAPCPVLMTRL